MAFIMSGVLTFINVGMIEGFLFRWLKSFFYGLLIAFPTAFFVAPLVNKIVQKIISKT